MALELKLNYNHSKDGKSLVLQDDSNWIDEGILITDVTEARITIIIGDKTASLNVLPEFITGDLANLIWTLTSDDFGGTDGQILEDGVYNINYSITVDGDDYEITGNVLLYYNVKLYVYNKYAVLPNIWSSNLCDKDPLLWANKLNAALKALEYSAYLGNISKINKNLEFLQKLTKVTSLYELNNKL